MTTGDMNSDASSRAGRPRDLSGRTTVAGLFELRPAAEHALEELKAAGFTSDQLSVARNDPGDEAPGRESTAQKAAEGIGPIAPAAGDLASALSLAGGMSVHHAALGAAAGGLVGGLASLGVTDEEARYFQSGFKPGTTLIAVNAGERAAEALQILERNGADTGGEIPERPSS